MSGFLSYRVPRKAVTKKPPCGWAALFLSAGVSYFTRTFAIPTTIWSLRIRTEIMTIRERADNKVFMSF